MLSECETEEQLMEIMKLKDQLMDSYYGNDGKRGDDSFAKRQNEELEQKAMSEHFYNNSKDINSNSFNNMKGQDEVD